MSAVLPVGDGFVVGGHIGGLVGANRAAFWRVGADGAWQRVADGPVFDNSRVTDLAALPDGSLVAVGVAGDAKTATGAVVWVSPDGRSWTRTGDAALDGAVMLGVASGPAGLVAVGADLASTSAVAWTSPDGHAWMPRPGAPVLDNFGLKIEMRDVAWTPAGSSPSATTCSGRSTPPGSSGPRPTVVPGSGYRTSRRSAKGGSTRSSPAGRAWSRSATTARRISRSRRSG